LRKARSIRSAALSTWFDDALLIGNFAIMTCCYPFNYTALHLARVSNLSADMNKSFSSVYTKLWLRRHYACSPEYMLYFIAQFICWPATPIAKASRALLTQGTGRVAVVLVAVAAPLLSFAAEDDYVSSSRPPLFDGSRGTFLAWYMAFSGFVAWKLTDSVELLDGEAEPDVPEPDADNADEVEAAVELRDNWRKKNRKLYGLLLQAVPDWLRTSLYNAHRNDGIAALQHLRDSFDVNDANDHAACIARLQAAHIDNKAELNEGDLRRQFDSMQTALAGIARAGQDAPADATLKAMFDNALPMSYSHIRQLVRRSNHATFLAHYTDYVSQVRAELASRRTVPAAFAAHGGGKGGGRGGGAGASNGGGGGYDGGRQSAICLRCGQEGHTRPNCTRPLTQCTHCSADHFSDFCEKSRNRQARAKLGRNTTSIIKRDMKKAAAPGGATPTSYANAAAAALTPPTAGSPPQLPPAPPAAPPADPASYSAHAAAIAAGADPNADATNRANAYAAAMRMLGFMCRLASGAAAPPAPPLDDIPEPCRSKLLPQRALTDSMATFWIVPSESMLWRVTQHRPGLSISTADGMVMVEAVGIAHVYMYVGNRWECYEVPNVLVLPNCESVLYSTRVMRDLHGFTHDLDHGVIHVPGAPDISVLDDGSAYSIPIAFVPPGINAPALHRPARQPVALAAPLVDHSPLPEAVPHAIGTQQSTLYHRLGFPYADQWRLVSSASKGHGLPDGTRIATDLPVRDAVVKGRARALPFHRPPVDAPQPPPGAVFYMDFAGPMLPSHPHKFKCYCGVVDAGSGYCRLYPGFTQTATIATAALKSFIADVGAKLGMQTAFKPLVVRSDQGSAFVSHAFREFLADEQISLSLAATYTPQQNSHIERAWGTIFGTARVLLAASNLPPTLHPFALQAAAWIHNRLPRPARGGKSPFEMLSRELPDLTYLHTFGCLCSVVIPPARREGDRHFADRGEHAIYLGPSEESPASIVYLLSSRRITTTAKLRLWEDQFPGIDGMKHLWFADGDARDDEPPRAPSNAPASHLPPPPPAAPPPPTGQPAPSQPVRPAPAQPISPPPRAPPAPRHAPAAAPQLPTNFDLTAAHRHPSADDPRSIHFERRHPQRQRGPVDRLAAGMGSSPGSTKTYAAEALVEHRYGNLGALLLMPPPPHAIRACVASAIRAFVDDCGGEGAMPYLQYLRCDRDGHALPDAPRLASAYVSVIASVDAAFRLWDPNQDANALLATTIGTGHALAVTITKDMGDLAVPKGYRQALNSPQAAYWKEAIAKEIGGLVKLNTWDVIDQGLMPKNANLMNCHFVFTVKRRDTGEVEKFKARLVADGNTQKHGVDFDRVFATVVKATTIRLVLAISAARDYNLTSIDIRQAYLQAELKEELFMRMPPGIHAPGKVCKLRRSLYGLKQAGREWATLFSGFLASWGLVRSTIDVCLYTFTSQPTSSRSHGSTLWVLIYVDDALIADDDSSLRDRFVADLSERFPTEDKGELTWILNMGVRRDRPKRKLILSQELYVADLLAKYASFMDASTTRTFDTPMDDAAQLSIEDCPTVGSDEHSDLKPQREIYMSIVGGLLWLANMTRFDIAYAASQLSRALTNPSSMHLKAAARVLIYLRHTQARTLIFQPDVNLFLDTYVDSSWAVKFSCSGVLGTKCPQGV